MLKRLWIVLSVLWAVVAFTVGTVDRNDPQQTALLAVIPFAVGAIVSRVLEFVVTGR